jgi:hypothetical protein
VGSPPPFPLGSAIQKQISLERGLRLRHVVLYTLVATRSREAVRMITPHISNAGPVPVMIGKLSGIELPPHDEFRRDCILPQELRGPDIDNHYDFHTLIYDAFYVPGKRSICLICPKLLNFESLIREGRFTADGENIRISSIWQFKRYAQIWLRCRRKPANLRFQHGTLDATMPIPQDQSELFRGLNCAVLKSKDNDLAWIRDWAQYHVGVHGLQGLIFFDNASTRYEPADIVETLQKVPGLQRAQVISAPFRFGHKRYSDTMFLQVGLLNIARLRFCSQAAAVLCTDLDELVKPVPPAGIFAATRRSPLGYLLFRGRWRHSRCMNNIDAVLHSSHVYRTRDDMCPATKYCVSPQGLCGFSHWDVHGAVRGFLKNYLTTSKIEYWHCRQISTSWKFDRGTSEADQLEIDPETARILGESFAAERVGVS